MFKIKEDENYNHRNTLKYFEDYNLSLTQRLGKIAILGQPPRRLLLYPIWEMSFFNEHFGSSRPSLSLTLNVEL